MLLQKVFRCSNLKCSRLNRYQTPLSVYLPTKQKQKFCLNTTITIYYSYSQSILYLIICIKVRFPVLWRVARAQRLKGYSIYETYLSVRAVLLKNIEFQKYVFALFAKHFTTCYVRAMADILYFSSLL